MHCTFFLVDPFPCATEGGKQLRYMESPAWRLLNKQHLVATPRNYGVIGCGLCYNRHGQWLGLYPEKPNCGRTFRQQFRSERKALLQVLIYLWKCHAEALGSAEASKAVVEGMPMMEYIELLCDEQAACLD